MSHADDLRAIEALHETDRQAMLRYDVETLIGLWEADGILMPPESAPVVGKDAIAARLRRRLRSAGSH